VDIVIDCRFLPNPHYVDELRPLSGLDAQVAGYVMSQPVTEEFLERMESLLAVLVPQYVNEGKSYLTVAFGCTGGRHRSVAVTEHFAGVLGAMGHEPAVVHRDIDR
ncbi:MAG: RNase adaptor protein RapZ, partial [Acidimicrobiaceae bacterium]|nr:RNase adaptor protein RapZ [Acidimicrobiaceae bacterium]